MKRERKTAQSGGKRSSLVMGSVAARRASNTLGRNARFYDEGRPHGAHASRGWRKWQACHFLWTLARTQSLRLSRQPSILVQPPKQSPVKAFYRRSSLPFSIGLSVPEDKFFFPLFKGCSCKPVRKGSSDAIAIMKEHMSPPLALPPRAASVEQASRHTKSDTGKKGISAKCGTASYFYVAVLAVAGLNIAFSSLYLSSRSPALQKTVCSFVFSRVCECTRVYDTNVFMNIHTRAC